MALGIAADIIIQIAMSSLGALHSASSFFFAPAPQNPPVVLQPAAVAAEEEAPIEEAPINRIELPHAETTMYVACALFALLSIASVVAFFLPRENEPLAIQQ